MIQHFIYVISAADGTGPVKIGFSKDPYRRLRDLQTAHPSILTVHHREPISESAVRPMEKIIHKTLKHKRTQGEWFDISPADAVAEVRYAMIRYGDEDDLGYKLKAGFIRP